MQTVVTTQAFESDAARAKLSQAQVDGMVTFLAANPLAGDLMPGTGGARKVRFAREGEGKSGGYRTIHYFGGGDVPLFLLVLVDKRQRSDLTKADRNALAALLPTIAATCRAAAAARLKGKKE